MPTIDELLRQHGGFTPSPAAPVPASGAPAPLNAEMPPIDGYGMAAGLHAGGAGAATADQATLDLQTLNPLQLMQKYGPDTAFRMMEQAATGIGSYARDAGGPGSTGGQILKEGAANIAGGFANSILGLGGLAVGAVSDAGGATIAGWQEGVTDWQQGIEDDQTQGRRRAMQARGAQRARDDAATYEAEKETHGSTLAGLRNIGREALSTIKNYGEDDSMMFAGTTTAVGSLAAGGPIGKGVKVAGLGIKGAARLLDDVGARTVGRAAGLSDDVITANIAARNAAQMESAAAKVLARDKAIEKGTATFGQRASKWIDENGATTAGLVGMESGGAYTQTVNQIMGMTHEQLMQGSEPYRQLIAQNVDPAEAKMQVAGDAGLEAAAKMAPTALLPAAAVARFERNILSQGLGVRTVANVAGQAPEEAFQGGMSQIYGNQGIQKYANDKQDWSQGAGAAVGEGALFGTMAAGAVQSPGLALTGTAAAGSVALKGVGATLKGVGKMLGGSEDSQSSPGSNTAPSTPEDEVASLLQSPEVQQRIQERMAAEAQQTQSPKLQRVRPEDLQDAQARLHRAEKVHGVDSEQAQKAREKYDRISADAAADSQDAQRSMSQPVTELVGKLGTFSAQADPQNFIDSLQGAASPATMEVLQESAGKGGLTMMRGLMDRIQNPKPGDDVLDLADTLEQFEQNMFQLSGPSMDLLAQESDPLLQELHRTFTSVVEDMRTSPQYIAAKKAAGLMATEAQDQVDVTEPAQVAKVVDQVVRNAPENLNPELATHLRALHASGEVTMSDGQLAALSAAEALVSAEKAAQERLEAAGIQKSNTEKVTSQIRTESYSRGKEGRVRSMAEHVRTIIGAATSGNTAEARAQIEAMHDWALGQANKIEAYNQALREGKRTSKDTVKYVTRSWKGEMVESKEGVFIDPAAPKSVELAQRAHADAVALTAAYNGIAAAFPDLGMPQLAPPVLDPELQGRAADVAARSGTSQAGTPITRQNRTGTEGVSTAAAPADTTPANDVPPPPPKKKKAEEYQHPKGFTMSKTGMAHPYAKWKEAGWTDEDLVEAGHMTANQEEKATAPAPSEPPAPPSKPDTTPSKAETAPTESTAAAEPAKAEDQDTAGAADIWDASPATVDKEASTGQGTSAPNAKITLNEGQKAALSAIAQFLDDKDATTFALTGSAGTGKTTLMTEVIKLLESRGKNYVLSSPTHRANAVLEQKNPNSPVKTLHKLLGLRAEEVDINDLDAKNVKFDPTGDHQMPTGGLVIVDESSMINDELYDLLRRAAKETDTKILFLGDLAQLPPVSKNKGAGKASLSKALTGTDAAANLTEVMRAGNSALLDESVRIREKGSPSYDNNMVDGAGAAFTADRNRWLSKAIGFFKSPAFKKNPLLVRLLAYTNSEVAALNAAVRSAMFPGITRHFVPGDILMGYAAAGGMQNGVDYRVTRSDDSKVNFAGVEIPVYRLTVVPLFGANQDPIRVNIARPDMPAELAQRAAIALRDLGDKASAAKRARNFQEARALWKQFFGYKDLVSWSADVPHPSNPRRALLSKGIDYGYAHTIHKSQGGTYTFSFVNQNDITSTSDDKKLTQQLMYVGVTRASKGAFVLSNQASEQSGTSSSSTESTTPVDEAPATPVDPTPKSIVSAEAGTSSTPTVEDLEEALRMSDDAAPQSNTPDVNRDDSPGEVGIQRNDIVLTGPKSAEGFLPKDQAKSHKATGFIGKGRAGSSTALYAKAWGALANTGKYDEKDILFVSSNGNSPRRVDPLDPENGITALLDAAMEAGAKLILDTAKTRRGRKYLVGERQVAAYLESKGYKEIGTSGVFAREGQADFGDGTEGLMDPATRPAVAPMLTSIGTTADTAIAEAYPEVRQNSALTRGFMAASKLPAYFKETSPLAAVTSAIEEMELPDNIREGFQDALGLAAGIAASIKTKVEAFANQGRTSPNQRLSRRQLLGSEWSAHMDKPNLRIGHLLQETEDGRLVLPQKIAEAVGLAAANFVTNSILGQTSHERTAQELIQDLGLPVNTYLSPSQVAQLNRGASQDLGLAELAGVIETFLGLRTNPEVPVGLNRAITGALAGDVMMELVDQGFISRTTTTIALPSEQGESRKFMDVVNVRVITPRDATTNELHASVLDPTVIERAAFGEELESSNDHIGKAPKAKETRHNQDVLRNTPEQIKLIQRANDEKYFANVPLFAFMRNLGLDLAKQLFADGDLKKELTNVNDLESSTGRNRQLEDAYTEMMRLGAALTRAADEKGVSPAEVAKHYFHNIAKSGRLHMFGKSNPQGSKFMRALMLPTWDTLDMGLQANQDLFDLAVAQGLGVKVHTKLAPEMKADLAAALDKVPQFRAALKKWVAANGDKANLTDSRNPFLNEEALAEFQKAGFSDPLWAMHVLMEQARLEVARDNGTANDFRTSIYVEADGVTNGPANVLMMFMGGAINWKRWLKNANKVGRSFGTALSLQELRNLGNTPEEKAEAGTDLYQATGNTLTEVLEDSFQEVMDALTDSEGNMDKESAAAFSTVREAVLEFLDLLSNGDVTFDGSEITIKRGITKNPLTITLYGSGARGISENVVNALLEELYAQMSQTLRQTNGQGTVADMFSGDPEQAAKVARLERVLHVLTSQAMSLDKDGKPDIHPGGGAAKVRSLQEFTLKPDQFKAMVTNMRTVFVDPMRQAIETEVGNSVTEGMKLVQDLTIIQSLVAEQLFNQKVAERLEAMKNAPRDSKTGLATKSANNYLSQMELDQIMQEVLEIAPPIEANGQTFSFLAQERSAPLSFTQGGLESETTSTRYMGESSQGIGFTPRVGAVRRIGVAAIPGMVIGMGDANMVQEGFLDGPGLPNAMGVFDGVNVTLSNLAEQSERLNRAVLNGWARNNPVQAVLESYARTMEYLATLPDTKENRDLFDSIGEVIDRSPKGPRGIKARDLAVREMQQSAAVYARASGLNQGLVQGLSGGVDQMATGSSPAVVNGVDVSHLSQAELAALLARESRARTSLTTDAIAASNPNAARETRALRKGGAVATGTLMDMADGRQSPLKMGTVDLLRLTRDPSFPKEYAEILREVLRNRAVDGWEVVVGTGQELVDTGEPVLALEDGQLGAATITGPNQGKVAVRLDNDNPEETLTHELLHVGTLQLFRDYFSGKKLSATAKLAIENLIDLSTRFDRYMQENFESTTNEALRRAMRDYMITKARINRDTTLSDSDRQALALSEFVSWTLANPALREALKNEPSKGWMPQMLRKVKEAIRRMFWGKSEPGPDTTRVLGAIQFWSTVVVRTEPKGGPPGPRGGVRAFHSTSAPVVTGFARATQAFLNSPNARNQTVGQQEVRQAIQDGVQAKLAAEAAGFPLIGENADAFSSTYVALKALPLDSMSVGEVGKLHRHTLRELRPVHFSDDQTVSQEQRALYDFVMGTDQETFAALAAASPELRKAMGKLDAPKRMQVAGRGLTLDEQASEVANNVMEKLQQMATRADNSKDVVRAMDTLLAEMSRRAGSDPSFLDQAVTGANGLLTQLEDKIVAKMGEAGEAGRAKAASLRANAKGRAGKTAASVLELGTALLDDAGAEAFGETALSLINKVDGFQPVRRFIADLVGTNDSNEGLLTLVKKVRSGIQQERNRLRAKLPEYFAKQFSRKVTAREWKAALRGLGQSDLASLLSGMTRNMALDTLRTDARLNDQITRHEAELDRLAGNRASMVKANALLLAKRMAGERNGGSLRNAYAVALGVGTDHRVDHVSAEFAQVVDRLATLYNVRLMDTATKESLRGLLASDSKAVGVMLDFMVTQRKQEMAKINAAGIAARLNHEKGFMLNAGMAGRSITVAPLADKKAMEAKGYRMVGKYEASSLDPRKEEMAYYYTDIDSRGTFNQGIIQTVQHTGFGVLLHNGKPLNDWGTGLITRSSEVERISNLQRAGMDTVNGLEPIFDKNGDIAAYARPVDRSHAKLLMQDDNLATSIANWEGRLVEEAMASEVNVEAWNQVKKMADTAKKEGRLDEYIDLFGPEAAKMPVVQDAISNFPKEVLEQIESVFGKDAPVMVRKELLEDLIGYRSAALTDFWTGTTNWSPETQRTVRHVVEKVFGPGAYKWIAHGDRLIKGAVLDAREMIAMKSGVVPVINIVSNVLHLISRGVSPMVIAREIPRKLVEIQSYVKMQERKVALEIDQRAQPRAEARRRIEAELLSIDQSMRKMSIWPLIEAGEFTALTDLGLNTADLDLTNGRLSEYLSKQIDKIPNDVARSLAHNLVISRDSALYVALQKSVHYGDFIGKAVMYDHLTQRRNKPPKMALRQIADEFVNYDRLPGRARGALESYGMLWFYNFKIRSVKVAASTIRNNPLHLALAAVLPIPDVFSGVGLPIGDNIFTKLMEGSLDYSIGPGMGFNSWTLNPWFRLVN